MSEKNANGLLTCLVSADDYEMNEPISLSLIRTGDRILGFLTGLCFLGATLTVWHFM